MFAQIMLTRTQCLGVRYYRIHRFELVIPGKDQGLGFVGHAELVDRILGFHIHEAVKDAQPGIALANLLPKVGYRIFAVVARLIARMTVIAFVEG